MEREVNLNTEDKRRKALEDALARVRPVVKANTAITNTERDSAVMKRLSKFAMATPEKEQEKEKRPEQNKNKKPLSLIDITKKQADLDNEAKKHGVDPVSKKNKKDEKEDQKDKNKDKEKEDPVAKKEQEMKETFSKVKLPSGMEIHQEGPVWVLVSKDGKQKTNITDVMNTIDKYNNSVEDANAKNKMQDAAQSGVDKAADVNKKDAGLNVNDTNDKVKIVGEALPNVKDVEGKQVFDPADLKKVAETAINFSDANRALEAMKLDPKALEDKANDRRKKNDREADERNAKNAARLQQMQQTRGASM